MLARPRIIRNPGHAILSPVILNPLTFTPGSDTCNGFRDVTIEQCMEHCANNDQPPGCADAGKTCTAGTYYRMVEYIRVPQQCGQKVRSVHDHKRRGSL